MMRLRITQILLAALCILPLSQWAQDPCATVLNEIFLLEDYFETGQFDRIIALRPCVSPIGQKLKKDKKENAELSVNYQKFLRLLTMAYQMEGRDEEAVEIMQRLLNTFPKYDADPSRDIPQFIQLYDSFEVYRGLVIGPQLGMHYSMVEPMSDFRARQDLVDGTDSVSAVDYDGRLGASIGASIGMYFDTRNGISLSARYSWNKFRFEHHSSGFEAEAEDSWQLVYNEEQFVVEFVTMFHHRLGFERSRQKRHLMQRRLHNRVVPSLTVNFGPYLRYLVNALNPISTIRYERGLSGEITRDQDQVLISSLRSRRKIFSWGLQADIGVDLDHKSTTYYLRLGGRVGLTNLRKVGTRYERKFEEMVWNFQLDDNDFRFHHLLEVTAGMYLPLGFKVKYRGGSQ